MARPGMTEGVGDAAAPEASRLDVDPGRNVGTAELAAGPATAPAGSAEAREDAQAAQRREASPPSYHGSERTDERPWPAMVLVAIVLAVIVAAFVLYFA